MENKPARTPALMIQGTSSNVGKSLLAAALCRIFTQDGLRAAPFKAQNMALNSCVTPDGREMGRAQAMQAAACGLPPDVRMNPVLLKPVSDNGSQVILLGKPAGVMRVREYWAFKPRAFAAACAAYDELAADADVMILEGAGSPAEINLRRHDIVNMSMARHAGARVLLAGDIDRGGVFAALAGTMALLEEWERDLVFGLVVNKFRGDASLLPPALDFVRTATGKPVLGVVPWIEDPGLPDEDSLGFREGRITRADAGRSKELDVVLIDLPRVGNVTDLDALRVEPDVRVRVARRAEDIAGESGRPDLIVLPGSADGAADLDHLRTTGLAAVLFSLLADRANGPVLIGIGAGLRLLGRRILNPPATALPVFSAVPKDGVAGLDLLPLRTVLEPDAPPRRVRAASRPEGLPLTGYALQPGQSGPVEECAIIPWIVDESGSAIGWQSPDGRIRGTCLHGLFESDGFRRHLLDAMRRDKGLPPLGRLTPYNLESSLDRLAGAVRNSLDMDAVRAALGL